MAEWGLLKDAHILTPGPVNVSSYHLTGGMQLKLVHGETNCEGPSKRQGREGAGRCKPEWCKGASGQGSWETWGLGLSQEASKRTRLAADRQDHQVKHL